MHRVDVEEAKTALDQLVNEALRGEDVVLTQEDRPVARLVALAEVRRRPQFGSASGLVHLSPDFDAPLEDFDDYVK